jgi:hypothetical protein
MRYVLGSFHLQSEINPSLKLFYGKRQLSDGLSIVYSSPIYIFQDSANVLIVTFISR